MVPERLTSLDASFLYLERPAMHMHVAGLSVFGPRPDGTPLRYEDVERTMEDRIHLAPRLRQKVMTVPGNLARPVWADDDRFDLDFHLRRSAVPRPHGRTQLERAVGRVLSRQLDRSKPLWELYVFEELQDDRTAVLLKMHHAMTDGISGMLIASALFDLAPGASAPPPAAPWNPEPVPSASDLVRDAILEQVANPFGIAEYLVRTPSEAVGKIGTAVAGVRALAGMGRSPRGPFDVQIGPNRRFAMTEAPFERFRDIKRTLGGTVNDVVLACVAGGLQDLLRARKEPTRGRTLRVMVPVSVRSQNEQRDVGNRVAPAFVDVPVGAMSAKRRLARIREATAALKVSPMAVGAGTIIGWGAYAPPALHAAAARLASRGRWFNLVVSNVPAPQVPLYLAGARLAASYPSMPLNVNAALSIACTSLAGSMAFGLTADWDAVPDLDVLVRGIDDALADLTAAARV
ncbi:MAG TPA: wax ester/triacylglycerol synthase family O-acyltransferase [Actinomycetota bacterium]|nr:wax ester/triacylglycerol synthase family O-acyltransferase [Actinomycetota bacterium]